MTGLCYTCDCPLQKDDLQILGLDGDHWVITVRHHRKGHASMQTCPTYLMNEHGDVLPSEACA